MEFNIDKSLPICPQICDQISVAIANGTFPPNSKLWSVREVAVKAGVNPNTVQKSFESLEREGFIYSIRGSGWFVSDNKTQAQNHIGSIAKSKTKSYFSSMSQLGLTKEQIINYIKECNE